MSKIGMRNMMRYRRTGFVPRISTLSRMAAASRIGRAARQYLFQKRRKKNVSSGVGITTQHDARRVYRKKYMPRKKKARWKSFVRKVNAVAEKELGARQVVFNKLITRFNDQPANHLEVGVCLYGQTSTISEWNDLNNISSLENTNTATPDRTKGELTYESTKYMFQSGVLDITVRNASTFQQQDARTLNSSAKMEVDVYEITMRKPASNSVIQFADLGALLATNDNNTEKIDGGSAEISHDLRGVTPFELSFCLSRYGIKIEKKTKYLVPNGEVFTYQVRDPKRHSFVQKDIEQYEGFNRPGVTRVVYFIAKLVPGLTVGNINGTYQELLNIGCTRKYLYKIEGNNDDRTAYEANT